MYEPNLEKIATCIREYMEQFASITGMDKVVLGVSGGKDSTVCAEISKRIFGEKNVYGVSMPCDFQNDMDDVNAVFEYTKINRLDIDIGEMNSNLLIKLTNNLITPSAQTQINIQPRLRMTTLYAVGQSVNGIVLCCDNFTERILGYSTLWGDGVGSFAPLYELTKTEVVKLGEFMGIPDKLIHKTPSDGLCGLTDEDRMGFTYGEVDEYIRNGVRSDNFDRIFERIRQNSFKREIVNIPHPEIPYSALFSV